MQKSRRSFLRSVLSILSILPGTALFTRCQHASADLTPLVKEALKGTPEEKVNKLRTLEKQYGTDKVKETVHNIIKARDVKNWHQLAQSVKSNDIPAFIDILWNKYCQEGGLKWTESQEGDKTVMHCTYCPYVQPYHALDAADWGYELFCRTDYYMVEGFNPDIKFERTKTLMQGDGYCNHTYSYKTKKVDSFFNALSLCVLRVFRGPLVHRLCIKTMHSGNMTHTI